LSLITLLSGLGLILFVVGKFDYLGWKGEGAVSPCGQSIKRLGCRT
jgi:hypothetical protein